MWDATGDREHGAPDKTVDAGVSVANGEMRIAPAARFLNDPATVYPVTIDPAGVLGANADTMVDSVNSTWNYGSSPYVQVGSYDGARTQRAFMHFPSYGVTGASVSAASLHLYQTNGENCTPGLIQVMRLTSPFSTSNEGTVSYASQPSMNAALSYAGNSENHGFSAACPSAWLGGSPGLSILPLVQGWANGSLPNYGVALKTNPEPGATSAFKRIASSEDSNTARRPYISVTYNHPPNTPNWLGISPYSAGFVGTTTPTFQGPVHDRNAGNVRMTWQVLNSAGTTSLWAGATSWVASGGSPKVTVPSGILSSGSSYRVRAIAEDAGGLWSPWSTSIPFTVDTTAPNALSSLSCTGFPVNTWSAPATSMSCATNGVDGGTNPSTVARYRWSLDEPTLSNSSMRTGSSTTFTVPDLTAGWHTLSVAAQDVAGNVGATSTYGFGVGAGGFLKVNDGSTTPKSVDLDASFAAGSTATFQYFDSSGGWVSIPAADLSGGANPVALSGSTTKATPLVRWSAASTLTYDQVVEVRACLDGASAVCTPVVRVTLDRIGNGGASQSVGPGSVSVSTGNFGLAASDVSIPGARSGVEVSRMYNSFSAADSAFGPGWTASLPAAGSSDYTKLLDMGESVLLYDSDSTPLGFSWSGTAYTSTTDTAGLTLTRAGTGSGTSFTLTDLEQTVTIFKALPPIVSSPSPSDPGTFGVSSTTSPGQGKSGNDFDPATGLLQRAAAPLPDAGANPLTHCAVDSAGEPDGDWAPGCRDVRFYYDGDGHITKLRYRYAGTSLAPASAIDVACYTYVNGYLASAWDPRDRFGGTAAPSCGDGPVLATAYSYSSGRLTGIAPPGLAPWSLNYDAGGKVTSVSRMHGGGASETTTIDYAPNIAAAASGADDTHPDLSAAATAQWGQVTSPQSAVAIYEPGDDTDDLRTAVVHAYDQQGREINTAEFSGSGQAGWRVSTVEYDDHGNARRTLSAGNRALALNPADPALVPLGLAGRTSVQIASELDQHSVYSSDGLDQLETFGPMHLAALPGGVVAPVRPHTVSVYGQVDYPTLDPTNWVTQGPDHALLSKTVSARLVDGTDVDARTTSFAYALTATAPINADKAGWRHRTPMSTTTTLPGGTDLVSQTVMDWDTGLVVQQRQPSAAGIGSDPGVRSTTYFSSGAHSVSGCTSDAWFGQICRVEPGAQPGAGGSLPVTKNDGYDMFLRSTQVTESVPGSSASDRVTSTVFDANGWGGRATSSSTTGGLGTSLSPVQTTYYSSTGLAQTVGDGTTTLTTVYDDFGRPTSIADGTGAKTLTTFSQTTGRPSNVTMTKNDGTTTLATVDYSYGSTTELRGVLTELNDSDFGTVTGTYNADGTLISQSFPGGIEASKEVDTRGNVGRIAYVKSGQTWLENAQTFSVHGQVITDGGAMLPAQRTYAYDAAARLVATTESRAVASECPTRTYEYAGAAGRNGNRTGASVYGAGSAGECALVPVTSAMSSVTYNYDSADRLTGGGTVAYDAFGRVTSLPASMTADVLSSMEYYSNDFVRRITAGAETRTYGLDPAGRIKSVNATGVAAAEPITTINHYGDASADSPSWVADTTAAGTTTVRRAVLGIDGDVFGDSVAVGSGSAVVTLQLMNLHGDVVRTSSLSATGSPDGGIVDADEFGVIRDPSTAATVGVPGEHRYGWLGAKRRAADTGNGTVLMGVRLYVPSLGRFLQRDPVYGGNSNTYSYPGDPIMQYDLDGRWGMPKWLSTVAHAEAKVRGVSKAAWRNTKSYASKNKFKIAEMATGAVVGTLAVAGAAAICGATMGAGCVIIGSAMLGVALGTTSKAVAYKALGGKYKSTGRKHVLLNALKDLAGPARGAWMRNRTKSS